MPEEKRKGPPILSNPRYKSDEKECEGDCTKCMFADRCNRKRKAEKSIGQ